HLISSCCCFKSVIGAQFSFTTWTWFATVAPALLFPPFFDDCCCCCCCCGSAVADVAPPFLAASISSTIADMVFLLVIASLICSGVPSLITRLARSSELVPTLNIFAASSVEGALFVYWLVPRSRVQALAAHKALCDAVRCLRCSLTLRTKPRGSAPL